MDDLVERTAPLCISMGCPAGIGPEITIKALDRVLRAGKPMNLVVAGDIDILKKACSSTGLHSLVDKIISWSPGRPPAGKKINVIPVTKLRQEEVPWGKVTETTGRASYSYVIEAIRLCMNGQCSAMVTAPISKEGLKLAGINFPGHTEILAHETGTDNYAMMLAGPRLRVTLVTIHCALKDVVPALSKQKILDLITITDDSLKQLFLIKNPRIAVAGLNPHAGEGGMFGDEESRIIAPAVLLAQDAGINASGPLPPDTVFHAAWNGRYDAVVCMYHDQGLIPFKLVHFSDGVNITLGLPIIRASVDHGTAYDIAGKGSAHEDSMMAAIEMASMFSHNRATGDNTARTPLLTPQY